MGLYLTLIPFFDDEGQKDRALSQTILECAQRSELFEAMASLPNEPVPSLFNTYFSYEGESDEQHYGNTQETPYGDPLTCVTVAQLRAFSSHEEVKDNYLNRAVWAYLSKLPRKTRVALYWH